MRSLNEDIDTLGRCLGAVLLEQEGQAFFDLEERVRTQTKKLREQGADTSPMQPLLAAVSTEDAVRLVQAFSSYFLLINLAEEHERVRRAAHRERAHGEGLTQALLMLKEDGHTAKSAGELIASIDLGLTFTAHPTEMRRRTVRGHLEAISKAIPELQSPTAVEEITAHVEALWSTPPLRQRQPTVHDEVNAGLAYVDVLSSVLPSLERELNAAFVQVFGPAPALALPLSFHSWMGGDRDGNPFVTPEVTRETFALHAERARTTLLRQISNAFGELSQNIEGGGPDEPFRAVLADAHRKLSAKVLFDVEAVTTGLVRDVRAAHQSRSADWFALPLKVQSRIFGLHLVSLDIREHSKLTGEAVETLLGFAGIEGYGALPEEKKVEVLRKELATQRPLLPVGTAVPEALTLVLEPLRAARKAMAAAGPRAFGHYIVSMSEQASDLLEVLVLAREKGVCLVPVPLFETLADLQRAPEVMKAVLAMPEYRAALQGQVQEVMIGYSDSNKDAGFVAANWALHEAQREIAQVCADAGVRHRFFHGRGTSVGRGGGPMARGILGQPAGTIGAGIRITEQGEALGDKYSHPALARRNLEQGLYGLLLAAGRKPQAVKPEWSKALDAASRQSVGLYRALVTDPGFLPFFEAVTPIREISKLRIASRPVRRPGPALLANLRAIPWVMAWTQCRAIVPGWLGLGASLESIGVDLAREMYAQWPFFRSMLDNAQTGLAKSDMQIFRAYRTLSTDDTLGVQLEASFERAVKAVEGVLGGSLLSNEPRLQRSILLRNPYIEPIHRLQVELLRRARAMPAEAPLPEDLERALVLSLHGIAAGMRNTG